MKDTTGKGDLTSLGHGFNAGAFCRWPVRRMFQSPSRVTAMRSDHRLAVLSCGVTLAFCLTASVLLTPRHVAADQPMALAINASSEAAPLLPPALAPFPSPGAWLGDIERTAALEAVQLALSEVGDGATYVWHARSGRISGAVQPTQSFVDRVGNICRHIVVELSSAGHSRRTEGLACRLSSGIWQLEG
jgi:hypothetical protein